MKKRLFVLIAILIVMASLSYAESVDYSSMSFEDLSELKARIDVEYYSRPEADVLRLSKGVYVVGEDIPAGMLYFRVAEADIDNVRCKYEIYPDLNSFNTIDDSTNYLSGYVFTGR